MTPIIDLYEYKLNETESLLLEKETHLKDINAFATHYQAGGNKFFGHYNLSIEEALRDLALRIENYTK